MTLNDNIRSINTQQMLTEDVQYKYESVLFNNQYNYDISNNSKFKE